MSEISDKLIQREKLAALGELVSSIAHEINNPLSVIKGFAYLVKQDLDDEGAMNKTELAGYMVKMIESVDSASEIVRSLKSFARSDSGKPEVFAPDVVVKRAMSLVLPILSKEGISNELELDCESAMVGGNQGRFQQIVLNLVMNSKHALADRFQKKIMIRTWCSNEIYNLSFQDTGTGMSEEVRKRIFEKGFTTKDVDSGTGLGLPILKKIVEEMNGFVQVESKEGHGTEFLISIPLSLEKKEDAETKTERKIYTKLDGNVLVVDDEHDVRQIIRNYLESTGVNVDEASDGIEAMKRLAVEKYDFVFTDFKMPNMDGFELVDYIRRNHPDIGAIAMVTGMGMGMGMVSLDDTFDKKAADNGIEYVVSKPFGREDILSVLYEMADVKQDD